MTAKSAACVMLFCLLAGCANKDDVKPEVIPVKKVLKDVNVEVPQTELYPPWKGESSSAAETGLEFKAPCSNNLADFHGNPAEARLVIFTGGNYFFAMMPLVNKFVELHPDMKGKVFYETLPPGVLVEQMERDNIITVGNFTLQIQPDVFQAGRERVVQMVQQQKLVEPVVPFVRNKLAIMTTAESQKKIANLMDLGKPEVVVVLPNPETEGVTKLIKEALRKCGGDVLVEQVYGKIGTDKAYVTQVHHRQMPMLLMQNKADAGVAWLTEANYQKLVGHPVRIVHIPEENNASGTFAAARVATGVHREEARLWLEFIGSEHARKIFQPFGFEPIVEEVKEECKTAEAAQTEAAEKEIHR